MPIETPPIKWGTRLARLLPGGGELTTARIPVSGVDPWVGAGCPHQPSPGCRLEGIVTMTYSCARDYPEWVEGENEYQRPIRRV